MTADATPRSSRRDVLEALLAGLPLAGLSLPWLLAREATASEEPQPDRERRREAIARGCRWIASQANRDGSLGANDGIVALTALSVLALMAAGASDGRGPHGAVVRRGIDWLVDLVQNPRHGGEYPDGYFYHPLDPSSRMHGQGYATLALATAMGATSDDRYRRIRGVVARAVASIERAQTGTGGFGYEPTPGGDHEGSVTVTVAQGLRAARDAGLPIDDNVVQRGLWYLKRSQNPNGSFRYSVYVERSSYALTAAALSSFFLYGRYTDDRERTIERGLDYMMRELTNVKLTQNWYYYGNFYAAWACWQKDGDDWDPASGGYWARWRRALLDHILERQSREGWWEDDVDQFEFSHLLPTTLACLALSVPDEVLPIFQR